MKKYSRILTLVLAIFAVVCGATCVANAESDLSTDVPAFTYTNEAENLHEEFRFTRVPSYEEADSAYYRALVYRHKLEIETGSFIPSDEARFLELLGYNVLTPGNVVHEYDTKYGDIAVYEFPVLFEGPNGVELWYTTPNGDLNAKAVVGTLSNGNTWRSYGNVHYRLENECEVVIANTMYYSIVYNTQKEMVSVWEYGRVIREHFLPEDSIYAGFSENEGFIFRSGTDVYAVRDYGCCAEKYEVCLIARNVQFVISTNYEGDGSEGLSQPLFLMTDGTVQCYCRWYLDYDVPSDDESNLVQIKFERGFNL